MKLTEMVSLDTFKRILNDFCLIYLFAMVDRVPK